MITVNQLIELPLFLGMSKGELAELTPEHTFYERTVTKGTVLVGSDMKAERLTIVCSGTVTCSTQCADKSYRMDELLHAPLVIQPERIFGMKQRHTATFTTMSPCTVLSIEKNDLIRMLNSSMVFRLNFLNMVTTQCQNLYNRTWKEQPEDISQRIIRFISDHCHYPAGQKTLYIKMQTLARELGCSRLEVSQALHKLEDSERLILKREHIIVPMLQILK